MPAAKSRIEGTLHREFAIERVATPEASAEADQGTRITLSFSSETPYLRSSFFDDPWVETLGHSAGEVDLSRLNSGAAVLANHERYGGKSGSPLASIGVVERAWIENGKGYAEIRLSRRTELAGLIGDINDGIVRNISVGYQVRQRTLTRQVEDGPSEYRVTDWLPMEISIVDVPADATVGIGRSAENETGQRYRVVDLADPATTRGDTEMPLSKEAPAAPTMPDPDQVRTDAIAAERTRVADINQAVRGLRLEQSFGDALIADGVTADEARRRCIAKAAERDAAVETRSGTVEMTGADPVDVRRDAVIEALLHRHSPGQYKITDLGRDYVGLSLREIARNLLEARGERTRGLSIDQISVRAFQTSGDFPYVLAAVANKTLRTAYEAAPQTFRAWTRQASVADFKTVSRVQLGDAPSLEKVNEHGEYKYGSIGEAKETYALATYGKIVAISRQVLINDDLGAFTRLPAMMGRAAADLESDTVWGILTANAAMNDGVALFHADHANLDSAAAISVASLGTARTLMRKQTSIDGRYMNIEPRYLLVPPEKETLAQQYTSQAYLAGASNAINPFAGTLQVIAEPRLSSGSPAWYLAADPGQIDTIEYAYLEGQQGVYLETKMGFDIDGMELKVRLDFGAKALDFRGLAKNGGA